MFEPTVPPLPKTRFHPESEELILPRPDDFHVHFRQGNVLGAYVKSSARWFGRALAMPNTMPPIADAVSLKAYGESIAACLPESVDFFPLMSFKLLAGMDAKTVEECAAAGAVAGKYYPAGSTTNAADGPSDPDEISEALSAMESAGLVLSIHGEDPDAPSFGRETAFLPTLEKILSRWPRLRVVLEHLSTREAAAFVAGGPEGLAATISAHHLLFTIDDMLGGGLNPHLFCKPVIKSAADRKALREAVFSGSPKFFFGSDSAPHGRAAKESAKAPGGIYSSPTAIPALTGLFELEGALDALGPFIGSFGARFYALPAPRGSLRLLRETWKVPMEIDGSVPMCAGEELRWRLA